ncbi:MAG: helix-turn-helix domain-containing protein [Eubacterium sp.]
MEKKEKLSKFSVVLSQLRKERGISQKKAATDLGISQALLSHYEKGIRECGLDFVIKCSEYYGVTTDYLLGVSENRNGLNSDNFLQNDFSADGKSISTLSQATKYLLNVAAAASTNENERTYIYDYYMLSLYRGALSLAKAGAIPKEIFKIDYSIARELATAVLSVIDAKIVLIEDRSRTGADSSQRTPLNDLIEEAEEYILSNFIF